ncbi:hypothetical protein SAMN05444339_101184 [Loktanella atrilutea]|uniref:Lipoprotein n=1 Tax=Loktanella atrilutea TaxID=366533 RepID=A0A1M4SYH8_LOKAT|nr:hypothetical protein [Loktanella atrilutea]SHE37251.1 hypothetical protein SAMN05444339_101184 [Loktanella atrilutea]
MTHLTPALMLSVFALCACVPAPSAPPQTLTLSPTGYRADGDQCRLALESEATVNYLDDAADLVACPADMENLGVFAIDTGGVEVARIAGYVLYSVPTR